MFEKPAWINNTRNGCSCNGSTSTARTSNAGGLLFNPDPLVTVGVTFSRDELFKLAAGVGLAVFLGTILGNKISS